MKFKGKKTGPETPHLAEIRELLEDATEVPRVDMVRFIVCAASDDLIRATNSTEDLEIPLLIILGLSSISDTGSAGNYVCDSSKEMADWATTLRVCFAAEELRRRNLARSIVYPKNPFSAHEEESKSSAQYKVVAEIPADLSDRARGILTLARRIDQN